MQDTPLKEAETQKPESSQFFDGGGYRIAYQKTGDDSALLVVWAHGWGQNGSSFAKLIEGLKALSYQHITLDFPGFGESPLPDGMTNNPWGSAEYAKACAEMLKSISPNQPVIWIGHSFGCRVGTQLAAAEPDLISKMIFIGGAGLKRKRAFHQQLIVSVKIAIYKTMKKLRALPGFSKLSNTAGSSDYQKAGPLRGTLVKVVNENLSEEAAKVHCPTLLLYGENDTETPPEIGQRFNALIKESEMVHLPEQDHYSVLGEGRHQVAKLIKDFIQD